MRARTKVIAAVLVCLGATTAGGWYVWIWECSPPYLEIDFLSLNRGHGIFIRLPDKHAVLVDGGQSGDIVHELSGLLPFYRRSIDSIFITRPEAKYVGGLVSLIDRYSIGKIYVPKGMGTSTAEEVLLNLVRQKGISIQELSAGDSVELEQAQNLKNDGKVIPAVSVSILFPDDSFKFSNASPPQFVLDLSFGSSKVVLAGDASKAIQNFLAKEMTSTSSDFLKEVSSSTDILEYANSGGASNVSEKFIEGLSPKFIVIKSSGKVAKLPSKPQFTVHSYPSVVEDTGSSSVRFFSDGEDVWEGK